jgi:hypothetical protein
MKIFDLTEMPSYIDREMISVHDTPAFYSETTIKDLFNIVETSGEYVVLLRKDMARAIIGKVSIRSDGVNGVIPFGYIDFKQTPDLSWTYNIRSVRKCLQVNGAELSTLEKKQGLGSFAYVSLAKAGYTIISDTTHYLGGRKLWDKLARTASVNGTRVMVADNGSIVCDTYDGTNYPQNRIWGPITSGPENSRRHILLILIKYDFG